MQAAQQQAQQPNPPILLNQIEQIQRQLINVRIQNIQLELDNLRLRACLREHVTDLECGDWDEAGRIKRNPKP
jgi:regulator of replication initiation timing